MSPIAAVLWLWLSVSLAVYGYRLYRRATQGSKQARQAQERGAGDRRGPGTDSTGPASALIQNPIAGFDVPPSPVPPSPVPPSPVPPAPPASIGASAPSTTPASERRTARVPVAEAVQGIQLPCDLAPLLGDINRLDPFDVAFFTRTFDGDHVRDALAAELGRLGFGVTATTSHRLVASRADAELVVTVYPDPMAAVEGGRNLFPTAGDASVVARFQG